MHTRNAYTAPADLVRGTNTIAVAFLNDYGDENEDRDLFIDTVTVGGTVLSPTDSTVSYVVRNRDGSYVETRQGQRAMVSQGELIFTYNYYPRDWQTQFIDEYDNIGSYLACYGALLQVSVFPPGNLNYTKLETYPYFVDFEPKKRELYEAVSETGEVLSDSASNLNLRKGQTTADSTERSSAYSAGAASTLSLGPVSVGGSAAAQWGTKNISGAEAVNVRTTEDSRERRETFSRSTNLSQLYQLFNGYHLGTNRCVFFMAPRPHITDITENNRPVDTFAKGPRRLEGIQEVFLVVNRPKQVSGLCVDVLLETAHLDWKVEQNSADSQGKAAAPKPTIETLLWYLKDKLENTDYEYYNNESRFHHIVEVYYDPGSGDSHKSKCAQDGTENAEASGFRTFGYQKGSDGNCQDWYYADVDTATQMYYRDHPPDKPLPTPVAPPSVEVSMVITARSMNACLQAADAACTEKSAPEAVAKDREWVSYEGTIKAPRSLKSASDSNRLVSDIGRAMYASIGSRNRYNPGQVDFLHTKYVVERLRRSLVAMPADDPQNKRIRRLSPIEYQQRVKFTEQFPGILRRKDALMIPSSELQQRLGLSEIQARHFQLGLMGIKAKDPTPPIERRAVKKRPPRARKRNVAQRRRR